MKQTTLVRITPEAAKRLHSYAEQTGRSNTWIVSTLIMQPTEALSAFARETAKRRESIRNKIKALQRELL